MAVEAIGAGVFVKGPSTFSLHVFLQTKLEDSIRGNLFIQQMLKGTCARTDIGHQRQRQIRQGVTLEELVFESGSRQADKQ